MKFITTSLSGVFLIEPSLLQDSRGFFGRTWCQKEFSEQRLNTDWVQSNLSFNQHKGTLRGMHYQKEPHQEIKLLYCLQGSIYDVLLDLRADSATQGQWQAFELNAENHLGLYIPAGFAHGFQTLSEHCLLSYQMSAFYHPESAAGVRWNDPAFGIQWPLPPVMLSERDQTWPLASEA
ncbi:dTDP-4-dehydrorhamnose 3,5-epimerase [bacterium (Candidatus Blackallbacteria) CG17_big_fil_post_rev_8_21_14_2_50_48_46]|uniref:dTDP-4-dehydrorhamnose 3,5-epimerase n=1 Tax=bacterium (Candidatus Blackallbacteria) CG17_big_fil_post_rev_8_21_14_2_50_48_46 TaxID=2014261 RepID=A0A2M7GA99_9BACT|nr:MAG: dTDP-4-dehydrorhamnose 3,5-epimerase [bacterium (Candidatus Blackallbacteria) CG18_big_fil_WC_8_21_14_2_50_49_26]PIW19073.1 MAG: dTDP-4-dehydrorhamnose 3,5-epimerase [bacterium (Candidatus Blackallbacteria) CG17_big_fil_post_rev_8_21_14_2_50_48_46]PIW44560.1 MAG: dTDP-4-dehydrorhamnose 3,5-epimerase [bacterium (Candidatus Blackallbacteria) CG13_big_fil_rev_8_21_14_2_50_49_14]